MGLALAPSLLMGQVTGPLGWLQARSVHAASGEELELELFDQERLEVAVLDMADPGPELAARLAGSNIGTLRAEVIERTESMDRIVVRLEDPSCVRSGFPVVCGDGYVGVVDLDTPLSRTRPADQVEVVLITGKQSRIGARITGDEGTGSSELVVGGLSPAREVRLDVHNPRDRSRSSGEVEVYEPGGERQRPISRRDRKQLIGNLKDEHNRWVAGKKNGKGMIKRETAIVRGVLGSGFVRYSGRLSSVEPDARRTPNMMLGAFFGGTGRINANPAQEAVTFDMADGRSVTLGTLGADGKFEVDPDVAARAKRR